MNRRPAQVEWIPAQVQGKPGFRLMVILAAPGCAYSRTSGCTHCGFPQAFGTGRAVSTEDYLAQVEAALARIPQGLAGPVEVDSYNSGSYFNPDEVPEPAQVAMLTLAASRPEVASLLVETRPEYATAARLERAVTASRGKPLEIGIGLESANAEILRRRIRKGYTWEDFAAAAGLVAGSGARLLAYILFEHRAEGLRPRSQAGASHSRRAGALLRCSADPPLPRLRAGPIPAALALVGGRSRIKDRCARPGASRAER
jgi:radical SAM enzyme (TIGR01210 family)